MTVRQKLAEASPHVSLKVAVRRLIQVARRLHRAGESVPVRSRAEVERILDRAPPADWSASSLKEALAMVAHASTEDAEKHALERCREALSPLLYPLAECDIELRVHATASWLTPDAIDQWLGTTGGSIVCSPSEAARWIHHLDGMLIGGGSIRVSTEVEHRVPAVRRSDRGRRRNGQVNLWLPHWDPVGRLSLTPRALADQHAQMLAESKLVVFDPFCGLGGDAIAFALKGLEVISAEVDRARLKLAEQNAADWGVADQIQFHHGSGPALIEEWRQRHPSYALYLDPPWGGASWDRQDMGWSTLFEDYPKIEDAVAHAQRVVIKLPRAFDTNTLCGGEDSWRIQLALSSGTEHMADRIRFIVASR